MPGTTKKGDASGFSKLTTLTPAPEACLRRVVRGRDSLCNSTVGDESIPETSFRFPSVSEFFSASEALDRPVLSEAQIHLAAKALGKTRAKDLFAP